MTNPSDVCNGCTACAMRCTAGIKMAEIEYLRILEELRSMNPQAAHRVLSQPKEQPWFEEITYTACIFLDMHSHLCLIYPARPLICRLFGRIRHLPCPLELAPPDLHHEHLLQLYTEQPLRTFQEWMMGQGIFNFDDLLGVAREIPMFELEEGMRD